MEPKILYILSSYTLYGGTPKKTLDLMKHFGGKSVLYVYENAHTEFREQFEVTGGKVYEGFYGRNLARHVRAILRIIDEEGVNVVQAQFSMGELLVFWIKLFRPRVKVIVAFVSAIQPTGIKFRLARFLYSKVDHFVYISHYVKREKMRQFPMLEQKPGVVIYNGSAQRSTGEGDFLPKGKVNVLAISGLIELKNIQILLEAFDIIVNRHQRTDIELYVAGDGPYREVLEQKIDALRLTQYIHLLGYRENIGNLLESGSIFVHPSFNEGFGIVVAEAMLSEKPILVSAAGALPELVDHGVNGLVVDPHNALLWSESILKIADDSGFSQNLAKAALEKAQREFSLERFVREYEILYRKLLAQ